MMLEVVAGLVGMVVFLSLQGTAKIVIEVVETSRERSLGQMLARCSSAFCGNKRMHPRMKAASTAVAV